jgi:predicted aspartyl protease
MGFAKRLVALAAAVTLGAAAPSDPLAVAAAANGHPALRHLRGTTTRAIEGRRTVETLDQQGTTRIYRRCVAEVCNGSWFDGTHRWAFGLNEVPLPDEDPSLPLWRTLAAISSFAFAEPAFRAAGGSVEAAGRDAWLVRARGGDALIARLDPLTHLLRSIATERGREIESYRRYVRAEGAAFALERRGELEEFTLETVNAPAEPLQPPAGAAVTFSGDGFAALGADAVPIVPCRLGGRAARCLLDTGATPSAIVLPLAEALGLEPRGELEIAGFSRFATGYVDTGPLTLGAARFARARFAVIPTVSAASFDVVIGADLLGEVRLVLDRARGRAQIIAPRTGTRTGTVALHFAGGVPHVEVTLDGRTASALFDSGDSSVVSLGYAEYRLGPQWPVEDRGHAVGVAGGTDALFVTIPDVRVGTVPLGAARATVSRTQREPHVGAGLWSKCVIDLDEAAGTLGCTPR